MMVLEFPAVCRFALLALSLCACAAEDVDPARSGPVDDIIQTTLFDQIPLDSSMGYELASLSLHMVQLSGEDFLALVADDGEQRPLLIYLPASMRQSEAGFLVTLRGDGGRKLTTVVAAQDSGASVDASRFLSTIEYVTDYPDDRRELVHIELNEEDDRITAEIWCKRFGPAGFMGFGRNVLYEQAPVTFSLRRTLSVQGARVWLARRG